MAGALVHFGVGLVSGIVVYYLLKLKIMHATAIFVGNILPDFIKFGISSVRLRTLDVGTIIQDASYKSLSAATASYANWYALGFFALLGLLALYHYHYLKKNEIEGYAKMYVFLLIGVITHLILDVFVQERTIWI